MVASEPVFNSAAISSCLHVTILIISVSLLLCKHITHAPISGLCACGPLRLEHSSTKHLCNSLCWFCTCHFLGEAFLLDFTPCVVDPFPAFNKMLCLRPCVTTFWKTHTLTVCPPCSSFPSHQTTNITRAGVVSIVFSPLPPMPKIVAAT